MVVIGVIACAIGIPVALAIPWFPTDASRQAHNVRTLYDVLLIASVPIFVLVETVVLFSVWKFRMRPGQEEMDGPPIHGNTRLEVVWTAIPALLVVSLCTYAYTVLRSNEDSKSNEMTINVTASASSRSSSPIRPGRRQADRLRGPLPPRGPARRLQAARARRDPQLLRPRVLREDRCRARDHDHAASHADPRRDLSGRVHRAVRGGPLAHASGGHCVLTPARVPDVVEGSEAQRAASGRHAAAQRRPARGSPGARQPAPPRARSGSSSGSGSSRAAAQTSAAAGKAVFTGSAGCSSCHTLAAAGATGTVGPNAWTPASCPTPRRPGCP